MSMWSLKLIIAAAFVLPVGLVGNSACAPDAEALEERPVHIAIDASPAGLSIDPTTGRIVWTPSSVETEDGVDPGR